MSLVDSCFFRGDHGTISTQGEAGVPPAEGCRRWRHERTGLSLKAVEAVAALRCPNQNPGLFFSYREGRIQ